MPWFTSRISLTGEYTAGGAGIRGRVWGGTRGLKALRFLRLTRPWRAALPRFWMTSFRTEAVLGVRAIETVAESGRARGRDAPSTASGTPALRRRVLPTCRSVV